MWLVLKSRRCDVERELDSQTGESAWSRHGGSIFESFTSNEISIFAVAGVVYPLLASPEKAYHCRCALRQERRIDRTTTGRRHASSAGSRLKDIRQRDAPWTSPYVSPPLLCSFEQPLKVYAYQVPYLWYDTTNEYDTG